jgi:hypothetical protein
MSRKGYIVIVLVLTLCTAGAVSALPLGPETAAAAEESGFLGGLWDKLLDWLDRIVGGEGGDLTTVEMDTCHLDPNGACGGS